MSQIHKPWMKIEAAVFLLLPSGVQAVEVVVWQGRSQAWTAYINQTLEIYPTK